MNPMRSLNPKDIIRLLSKLKEETPEYPTELLEARKAIIIKQAATLKLQGKGQGGEGGSEAGSSGSGGSGGALGGGSAQGILLQALVGFSVIAALLITAFNNREKISDILRENDLVPVVEIIGDTQTPLSLSTPTAIATLTPVVSPSPTGTLPTVTGTLPGLTGTPLVGTPLVGGTPLIPGTPDGTKTNPGLHLGKTPGTPAAPGHGNPGNTHQPDKPDPPDKPDKPEKPPKPPKNK